MARRDDRLYVWLEAAFNLVLGLALLAYAVVSRSWVWSTRVSLPAAALVCGVLCLARAWRVVARHYRG